MNYDVIIIGGGAAGLCTAINSKNEKNSILIIEHNDRVGKKILKTGNGKCNLTNKYCKADLFFSNPEGLVPYNTSLDINFIIDILKRYDCDATIDFFKKIGVELKEKDGYVYPLSEQASSVLDALRYELEILGIDVELGYEPKKIEKKDDKFFIDDKFTCDKLVIATGGMSDPDSGSDGTGYRLVQSFWHTIFKTYPALCGLKSEKDYFKELKGVRADALVHVMFEGVKEPICSVRGNVQFNDYGLSGIPIMQVSGNVAKALAMGLKIEIKVDVMPDYSFDEVALILKNKIDSLSDEAKEKLTLSWLLNGLVNKKLASVFIKECSLSPGKSILKSLEMFEKSDQFEAGVICAKHLDDFKTTSDYMCARIAGVIKHFKQEVTETTGYESSQVTKGGIPTDEINPITLESLKVKNLFFAGELIDVDGICGGYNLQWAFSSAFVVSESLK